MQKSKSLYLRTWERNLQSSKGSHLCSALSLSPFFSPSFSLAGRHYWHINQTMDKYFQFILPRHGCIQFLSVAFIRQQHKSRQNADKERQQRRKEGREREIGREEKPQHRQRTSWSENKSWALQKCSKKREEQKKYRHTRTHKHSHTHRQHTHTDSSTHIDCSCCSQSWRTQSAAKFTLVPRQGQLFALPLSFPLYLSLSLSLCGSQSLISFHYKYWLADWTKVFEWQADWLTGGLA